MFYAMFQLLKGVHEVAHEISYLHVSLPGSDLPKWLLKNPNITNLLVVEGP